MKKTALLLTAIIVAVLILLKMAYPAKLAESELIPCSSEVNPQCQEYHPPMCYE